MKSISKSIQKEYYQCEFCQKEYIDNYLAERCEQQHRIEQCPHSNSKYILDRDYHSADIVKVCEKCGPFVHISRRWSLAQLPYNTSQEVLEQIVKIIESYGHKDDYED